MAYSTWNFVPDDNFEGSYLENFTEDLVIKGDDLYITGSFDPYVWDIEKQERNGRDYLYGVKNLEYDKPLPKINYEKNLTTGALKTFIDSQEVHISSRVHQALAKDIKEYDDGKKRSIPVKVTDYYTRSARPDLPVKTTFSFKGNCSESLQSFVFKARVGNEKLPKILEKAIDFDDVYKQFEKLAVLEANKSFSYSENFRKGTLTAEDGNLIAKITYKNPRTIKDERFYTLDPERLTISVKENKYQYISIEDVEKDPEKYKNGKIWYEDENGNLSKKPDEYSDVVFQTEGQRQLHDGELYRALKDILNSPLETYITKFESKDLRCPVSVKDPEDINVEITNTHASYSRPYCSGRFTVADSEYTFSTKNGKDIHVKDEYGRPSSLSKNEKVKEMINEKFRSLRPKERDER